MRICHAYREGNAVADGLANIALLKSRGFHELSYCPAEVDIHIFL